MLIKKLIIGGMFTLLLVGGSAYAAGDVAKGKTLAEDCTDCHGDDGLGDEDNPAIAGMPAKDQMKELMDFKSGERTDENEDMDMSDYSEQDMADLSAYYATLPAPKK